MAEISDNMRPSLLADLPEELGLAIIEGLNISSIIALSQTSQQFQRLCKPTIVSERDKVYQYLLEMQFYPQCRDEFACFSCTKLLPRESFADSQTRSPTGRNSPFNQQVLRFCIPCGTSKNLHAPRSQTVQEDSVRFVCRHCKEQRRGRFCEWCAICSDCDHTHFGGRALKKCAKLEAGKLGAHESRWHQVTGNTVSSQALGSTTLALASLHLTDEYNGDDHYRN